jgi:hypothetical protein
MDKNTQKKHKTQLEHKEREHTMHIGSYYQRKITGSSLVMWSSVCVCRTTRGGEDIVVTLSSFLLAKKENTRI